MLWGECIAGAMYINDFVTLCHEVGFRDPRQIEAHPIEVEDPELRDVVGNAKFFSVTFRLFKLANLERLCEDYGQIAIYKVESSQFFQMCFTWFVVARARFQVIVTCTCWTIITN